MKPTVKPFLKGAGGKRWLVHQSAAVWRKRCRRYFEPFLGNAIIRSGIETKQFTRTIADNFLAIVQHFRLYSGSLFGVVGLLGTEKTTNRNACRSAHKKFEQV